MSSLPDKDKYVVYNGIENDKKSFLLYDRDHDGDYDRPKAIKGVTLAPEVVPDDIGYMDHFWVELDDEGEIAALEPAPEMYEERKEDYQAATETFDEMKERATERLNESDDE